MSAGGPGAQRAPARSRGPLFAWILAIFLAAGALLSSAGSAAASSTSASHHVPKVVIVVGATGSTTPEYRAIARKLAAKANGYGANVTQVYSPNATWARVQRAARGANLFIYLGHGNGWPSQYSPFQTKTKDGLGLNRSASGTDYNTDYFGESFVESGLHLAKNSVVLLLHLCFASGNPEWGGPTPSLKTAEERVDNYGAGFLRTGAKVVVAEGLDSGGYLLNGLFKSHKTLRKIFWSAPAATGRWSVSFHSHRSPSWATAIVDPRKPGQYYRSIIGKLSLRASTWRG
jgi:hypothetical protein